jgi:hypothetical protein
MIKLPSTLLSLLIITLPAIAAPSITIFNGGFANVKEDIQLKLNKGENLIAHNGVTAQMEEESVILFKSNNKAPFRILEQSYRADPITQGLLLDFYTGETIEFINHRGTENEEIIKGKIIRSGYDRKINPNNHYQNNPQTSSPIIEVDGKLLFFLPGEPMFPALSDNAILEPTLYWKIRSDSVQEFNSQLSYITGGFSWAADYNFTVRDDGKSLDLIGWVTLKNESGKSFKNSNLKLMAGDVNKIIQQQSKNRNYIALSNADPFGGMEEDAITQKEFNDFQLYTLQYPTSLNDQETKQIEFIQAKNIKSKRLYVYNGAKNGIPHYRNMNAESVRNDQYFGTQSNNKVAIIQEFKNSEANDLGIPLPKGKTRFYEMDSDEMIEFVGENQIDHTAKDEDVRVYLGNAFDIVGSRKQTEYKIDHKQRWLEEEFEIEIRNRSRKAIEVIIPETLYRWSNWEIIQSTDAYEKTDSRNIEYKLSLTPESEKKLTYRVRYTW